nr:PREDICTED: uncharacterized protein LOC103281889 [Anolis carolinensis]|eukprot:XP_016854453.1 PREDICTED: uncharacterized protein LOC103281889 [Anolis carolinensis]
MDKEPMEAERVTKPGWSGPKERWGAPQRKRRGARRGSPKKGWSGSRGRGRGRGQGWSGPAKPRDSGDGFRKQQAEDFFHKRSPEPDGSFRKPQADDFFRKRSPEPDDGFRKQQAEDFFRKRSPEPNDGIRKQRAEGFSYKRSPEPDDSFRERSPEPARSRYSEEDLGDWSAESEVEDAKSGGKERAEERVLSRKGKLPAEAVASHPKQSAARTKWMPCKAVSHFWMTRCQVTIGKKARTYLRSTCPRPWLPDYSTRTPVLNKRIVLQLKRPHLRRLSYACRKWQVLENELLDMVGPAMTIYEMAEEALGKGESVEPLELREWARHLLRYAGSLSQRLLFNHRSEVLGTINPQLRNMAQKMKDGTANGRLFTDDDMMLVLEVLAKFPHLVQSPWMERVTPTGRDQPDSTRPWSIAEDFADARPSSSSYP